jgi:hypothetical protein
MIILSLILRGETKMSIPDYQSIMLPLLEFSGDEKEHLRALMYLRRNFQELTIAT